MPNWRDTLLGVLFGLLAAGAILLVCKPESGTPIVLNPAPTPSLTSSPKPTETAAPIQVQIGGEIVSPGVYSIEKTTRLGDLINIAGGLTSLADLDRINHASLLHDGDYFFIPSINDPIPETARNAFVDAYLEEDDNLTYPLDLNLASQEALETLPNIGPAKAEDIIEYRDAVGRFADLEELLNIEGIGEKTLETLRDYLIISP